MTRSAEDVLRRRLRTQRLTGPGLDEPAEVVDLLTAVQSQECAHAFWSLGLRSRDATASSVRADFDAGRFVRTHVLRPTWHFVPPADVRWLQRLTAPRVLRQSAPIFRREGLDESLLERHAEAMVGLLSGGRFMSRPELAAGLAEAGLPPASGQRLAYVVMYAELTARVCSGPMRGATHTYAVLDERCPPALATEPDDPLAELVVRFFTGHGPADERDLARWSSLTLTDVRAGLAAAGDRLESVEVEGHTLWLAPGEPWPSPPRRPAAVLLPLYDEALLSYPRLRFPVVADHPEPPGPELFVGSVILDVGNVGVWRRSVSGSAVEVTSALATGLGAGQRTAVAAAETRLVDFLRG